MSDRVEEMARKAADDIEGTGFRNTGAIIARHYRELVAPLVEAARRAALHPDRKERAKACGDIALILLRDYPAVGPAGGGEDGK